jgi:hypothetical protein
VQWTETIFMLLWGLYLANYRIFILHYIHELHVQKIYYMQLRCLFIETYCIKNALYANFSFIHFNIYYFWGFPPTLVNIHLITSYEQQVFEILIAIRYEVKIPTPFNCHLFSSIVFSKVIEKRWNILKVNLYILITIN